MKSPTGLPGGETKLYSPGLQRRRVHEQKNPRGNQAVGRTLEKKVVLGVRQHVWVREGMSIIVSRDIVISFTLGEVREEGEGGRSKGGVR